MPDLPEERSSSTPMVVGVVMEVVPSPERTLPRSTDLLLMPPDGSPRVWSLTDSVRELWYKLPTVSVLLDPYLSMFTHMVPSPRDTLILNYKI